MMRCENGQDTSQIALERMLGLRLFWTLSSVIVIFYGSAVAFEGRQTSPTGTEGDEPYDTAFSSFGIHRNCH